MPRRKKQKENRRKRADFTCQNGESFTKEPKREKGKRVGVCGIVPLRGEGKGERERRREKRRVFLPLSLFFSRPPDATGQDNIILPYSTTRERKTRFSQIQKGNKASV